MKNLDDLRQAGFDVRTENHASAILAQDFPEALCEVCDELLGLRIPDTELIQGGGGEAKVTQRLRKALAGRGWEKHRFQIKTIIDGKQRSATSHEIDHVRKADLARLALEIEWNNKDPFFDRDLDNFQRLHADGAISVGVVVSRGVGNPCPLLLIGIPADVVEEVVPPPGT